MLKKKRKKLLESVINASKIRLKDINFIAYYSYIEHLNNYKVKL